MSLVNKLGNALFALQPFAIAALLILVMLLEVAFSTRQESASWDEGDHIYAGYMNWKHGEYALNPEHPPLVKLVATLPLLSLDLKVPTRQKRYFKSEAYYGGHALLYRNGANEGGHYTADSLLFRIHMTVLVFGLTLALLLFLAGREMFGATAGLIAMTLFVFDPTVLTNAPFVTTDMGGACGFFASVYLFYRFVKRPSWSRALACGVVLGLALAAKHSMLVLPPLLAALGLGDWLLRTRFRRNPDRHEFFVSLQVLAAFASAFLVLWGIYSFRFAMHPTGVTIPTFAQEITDLSPAMQKALLFAAHNHLLPESYLFGLADVQKVGLYMPTYIFGKLYAHGQWFYFPAILSLKWSIGVLCLLLLSVYSCVRYGFQQPRELWYVGGAGLVYIALAVLSPLNIGVRHVLPLFPLTFLMIGAGAGSLIHRNKIWIVPVACLLLWHVADSVRMFPNYMPYANALWGGPSKTHLYFSDSATEWGQELKWTKQWTDAHHISECWFAYFPAPFLLPSDYGVPCRLLPTLDTMYEQDIALPEVVHGPLLISFADLNGFEFGTKVRNPYQQLFERQPDDIIANGVAVFYGDFKLPEAAALQFIQKSRSLLLKKPQQAMQMAQKALTIAPADFDANVALGDALLACGGRNNAADAVTAYRRAAKETEKMELTAKRKWTPVLEKRLASAMTAAT